MSPDQIGMDGPKVDARKSSAASTSKTHLERLQTSTGLRWAAANQPRSAPRTSRSNRVTTMKEGIFLVDAEIVVVLAGPDPSAASEAG